jgi:WD40 repeat protein/serine/threonine protein kinase
MVDRDLSDLCGRTLGDYLLIEPIGEGGCGAVYRAEQPLLKRAVVVKVLHQELRHDEVERQRFTREAQLLSRLHHPYAAHVYAFGIAAEDGLPWIAMELVHGITLKHWLATHGPMPLEQFVPFFERIAQVVQAAHERGIVHRDLKPSNVMVVEDADHLIPKLLDFGIAKRFHKASLREPLPQIRSDAPTAAGVATARIRATPPRPPRAEPRSDSRHPHADLTRSDEWIGSWPYMSPEQWSAPSAVGPTSDIYSLGIVAYETLTGRVPFTGANSDEYYQLHRCAPAPPLGGDFSAGLDRILQGALAKSPEERHGNALALAAALRTALRAEPREQLRSLARRWHERGRSPELLSRGRVLAELERCALSPKAALSELECSYLAESQRRARRIVWGRRWLVGLAALGAFQYRAVQQSRTAEQVVTQAEVEQGRSALLHNEPEAQVHLAEAYKRDPTPSTAFMLARALQARLAELARFASTLGRMWSAAFSPDGQRIVTTDDQSAQVRDAETGRLLFSLPHGDTVYHAVYRADGARLVTAGGDGTVKIWDAASGTLVRELKHDGRRLRYYVVALSPDGTIVAAIDIAGEVAHVWDADTGALLAELRNDAAAFPSLAFSADGRWLAASGGDDVRVFDVQTWAQVLTITGPRIHSLSFDPTGPRLVTGSTGGDAAIWAIPSGERIRHLREIGEPVDALAFSPNGELVVLAGRDGAAQVFSATAGTLQSQFNPRHSKILSIEFDPSSKLVLAAGADGAVVVIDAALGMPVTVLEGPTNLVRVAHFDPSARRVVGASWDGTARVWDATSPYRRWSAPSISDDCGVASSLVPDQRFVAVGCIDHPTRVWDTARDQLLAELPSVTQVDGDFASALPAVSAEGDRAAIARGNAVEIYELPGGRLLRTVAHGAAVNAVAFAVAGHDLVSGAVDGSLLVTRDGRDPIALPMSSGGIDAAGFLVDGRVVAADARSRLRVYDPGRNAVITDLAVPTRVGLLRMSPDGHRLITIPIYKGKDAPPVLWDLEPYRVVARLEGHVGRVYSVRFVADAIVTAGGDGTARLWNGATGQLRQTYRGSTRGLADATIAPDGSMVVAGSSDGLLRFWEATSGRSLWTLPVHKSPVIGIHFEGDDIVTRGFGGEVSRWTLPSPERVIAACSDREVCAIVSR